MGQQDGRAGRIAVCLSGGGFRAALFHAGALKRLNEFGILARVSTFCSVSGGSVINGVLATRWPLLVKSSNDGFLVAFDDVVANPIYDFCRKDLRTEVLLWDRVNPLNWPELLKRDYSVTDRLAASYAEHLDLGKPLSSLNARRITAARGMWLLSAIASIFAFWSGVVMTDKRASFFRLAIG